jgi:hypothetical protein
MYQFLNLSIHILESNEQDSFNMCLNFSSF